MIRLHTLGGLAVRRETHDGADTQLSKGKRLALLTYLAVERPNGSHSRDTLLALFWPESDDRHARDALSQLVRSIRHDLGDDIIVPSGRNGVSLDESRLWCDAVELSHAAERGDHTRVLELYRGDFLSGFHVSGSVEFEEWIASQRERLRELAVTAGNLLAETQEQKGEPDAAIRTMKRVLELQPYDETSLRRLMRLHLDTGERGRAVAAYEAYAELLATEFDASPSAETVRLRERARTRVTVREDPNVVMIDPPPVSDPIVLSIRSWKGRIAAGASVAAVVGIAAFAVFQGLKPDAPVLVKERILVDLFENQTGDPGLDRLSRLATDHVTAGLTYTTFADVVTLGASLLSRIREPTVPNTDAVDVAIGLGAGTLVTGTYTYTPSGDSVRFNTQLIDVETGFIVAPVPSVAGPITNITETLEVLRDRVMAAVGAHVDPRLETWSRYSSRPPTLEVYRTFVEGLEAHTTLRGRSAGEASEIALPLFLKAFEADTTFAMAAIWAVISSHNTGQHTVRDSLMSLLLERRDALTALDRAIVDGEAAFWAGDYEESLEFWRRVVQIAPGSSYLKVAAHRAFLVGRYRESLEYRKAADPRSGWLYGWSPFFTEYFFNLHNLEQCEDVPAVAELARQSLPSPDAISTSATLELLGFACLGDTERLMEVVETSWMSTTGDAPVVEGLILSFAAMLMAAHAPPDAEIAPFIDFVEYELLEKIENEPMFADLLAEVLLATGRLEAARDLLEHHDRPAFPILTAIFDLREGRQPPIEDLIEGLPRVSGWFEPDGQLRYWTPDALGVEAAIAAQMGDMDRAMRAATEGMRLWPANNVEFHLYAWAFGPLLAYPPFQKLMSELE